jgi:hypothetical protein
MAVTFLEPGGDADFLVGTTNGFWSSTGGNAPSIASDFVHGNHQRSTKVSTVAGSNFARVRKLDVVQDTGSRVSFYVYLVAYGAGLGRQIFYTTVGSGITIGFSLFVSNTGVLQLYNAVANQIGSNGSTLSLNTWYRISLAYTITSSAVNRFEVFVNGVSDISVTNATLTNIGSTAINMGTATGNATLDFRFSDVYVDDSNSLTDTGDIWVTAKRPNANGTSNQFTTQIGAGGSGYGSGHSPQVNERPLSTTNGWSVSNTTVQTEQYTIESKSTGDIDISNATIVDYMGWISAKVDSTSNSPVHNIIVNGVSTAKTMSTSAAIYTKFAGSAVYPTGNTDIGMDAAYTSTPHTTSLYECGIVVAYIPGTTTANGNFFAFM